MLIDAYPSVCVLLVEKGLNDTHESFHKDSSVAYNLPSHAMTQTLKFLTAQLEDRCHSTTSPKTTYLLFLSKHHGISLVFLSSWKLLGHQDEEKGSAKTN